MRHVSQAEQGVANDHTHFHVSQAEQGVANERLQHEAEANFYRNITTAAAAPRGGGGTRGKWTAAAQPRQLGARRPHLPHKAGDRSPRIPPSLYGRW